MSGASAATIVYELKSPISKNTTKEEMLKELKKIKKIVRGKE